MKSNIKLKYIKTLLLALSTVPFPLFISMFLYFIPAVYVGVLVPYFIGKIWINKSSFHIQKSTFIWKIPLIFFLLYTLFIGELLLIFLVPFSISFLGKIIFFLFCALLLRSIIYAMIIFIWHSDILPPYRKLIYAGILLYCVLTSIFSYQVLTAPDTDTPNAENLVLKFD